LALHFVAFDIKIDGFLSLSPNEVDGQNHQNENSSYA